MHALTHPGGAAEWARNQDFMESLKRSHAEAPVEKKKFRPPMKKKKVKTAPSALRSAADDEATQWHYEDKDAKLQVCHIAWPCILVESS